MAVNTAHIAAARSDVWAVLAEGWSYTNWVVGTSHMRAVEDTWPAVGAKIFHASGAWPLLIRDETTVESVRPGEALTLLARGRPLGQARVVIELADNAHGCIVTMTETPVSGPGRWVHNPVSEKILVRRNTESLARLGALAERQRHPNG